MLNENAAEPSHDTQLLIDKVAKKIVHLKLGFVAILFLESVRPLNIVSSQILHFFTPFVHSFGDFKDYENFAYLLEDRKSIDLLLDAIEKEEEKL